LLDGVSERECLPLKQQQDETVCLPAPASSSYEKQVPAGFTAGITNNVETHLTRIIRFEKHLRL